MRAWFYANFVVFLNTVHHWKPWKNIENSKSLIFFYVKSSLVKFTGQGGLIGIFECGYSTLCILSNFTAIQILREINFGWFQYLGQFCRSYNFGDFEFSFFEKFHAWKCQTFPNIQNTQLLKMVKIAGFGGFKLTKIDYMQNVSGKKFLKFPHSVLYSQLGCPGL